MMISSKGRYALRVMLDMAEQQGDEISGSRILHSGRIFPENIWKA